MRILALPAFKNRRENPYNAALYTALQELPGVSVAEFTNLRLILDRWDILHIHWPDAALHRRTAAGAALSSVLLILRLWWARLLGARIVWTVHNLRSHHTAHPGVESRLWKAFIPLVHSCIHLSSTGRDLAIQSFPGLASKAHSVIPHGHYRDSYPNASDRTSAREQLGIDQESPVIAFVGQIKAYKNIPALITAFLEASHPTARLLIAGRPGDSTIASELLALAAGHPRIILEFGLIPGERMHLYLNACDLAVFPYREIINSGSAILALSFNRPALVPARGAMAELRDLAGPDWIHTYDGSLTGPVLAAALDKALAGSARRPSECDLTALSGRSIAEATLETCRATLGLEEPAACPEPASA